MVAIVGIRVYLDFDLDESYTPTHIRFAAGTGYNDLQEFSVMRFDQPRGWIDVDWEGVGEAGEDDDVSDLPVLRCMLLQVRICENHQNGKDTHLRGLQIFAKDTAVKSIVDRPQQIASQPAVSKTPELPRKSKKNIWDLGGGWMDAPVLR